VQLLRQLATQTIFECFLKPQRFNRYICAASGELPNLGNDVALLWIQHDIGAHSLRHFHSNGVAIHTDDERSPQLTSHPPLRRDQSVPAQRWRPYRRCEYSPIPRR
jgi:hypothetical protein